MAKELKKLPALTRRAMRQYLDANKNHKFVCKNTGGCVIAQFYADKLGGDYEVYVLPTDWANDKGEVVVYDDDDGPWGRRERTFDLPKWANEFGVAFDSLDDGELFRNRRVLGKTVLKKLGDMLSV